MSSGSGDYPKSVGTSVHERDYNAIPNRAAFAKEFDDIENELKVMLKNAKNKGGSSCVIC